MAIEAVFFDIDGTLLNDRKTVPKSTQKAIKNMKKQGILIGVATGRGPAFVEPFMENLGLDFAITYNGQYIFTRDRILYQNQIPKSTIYRVIKYAGEHRREISLGTASGLVGSHFINMGTSRFGQWFSRFVSKKIAKTIERSFKNIIRRIKPQNRSHLMTIMRQPVFQIVLVATQSESREIVQQFPHLTVTHSSPYSIDLISRGMSKLQGIKRIAAAFDIELSEVMAFGDSDNDLEMLSGVGLGIAMGNATESVKEAAAYTTASNNDDGISKALSHFGVIHQPSAQVFLSSDDNFNKVKDFHLLMDGKTCETPRSYDVLEGSHRADFKVEEIVEFLYAASSSDSETFTQTIADLHKAIDKAADKVSSKKHPETPLVGQVDALIDLLYLTYGSFVLMGVDPKPFFDTVHEANMGKIFPDGKAHFDPVTHKILKPDDWEERFAPEPAIKHELDRQIQKSLKQ
ncbi:Cof-type HAD-IIB family hydrolase [Streptococcus macacae]|uniref:Cof-like hydrolase n=1 Tax=Streptococcus macacae NCTC 11558 TaxID=764298 RepID=G5JXD3_9STRE|nr:Cof-type HAD-IIB family hydrolase [Streptococcus macacae]EHJ52444.1 Cof-like hydrolase [Streptococcus macacae NCTC 11558]SUN79182.1 haloacid dehalogenase-like hydrolase [Streptococcus macacae NCTC 11558]